MTDRRITILKQTLVCGPLAASTGRTVHDRSLG